MITTAIGIAAWIAGPAILIGASWKFLRRKKKHFVEIECEECYGTGTIWDPQGVREPRVGGLDQRAFWETCKTCNGKGYVREFTDE